MIKRNRQGLTSDAPAPRTPCRDVRKHLTAYLDRELGDGRADLIREHLRRCEACRGRAADLATARALLAADRMSRIATPQRLSERRRQRLRWAFAHPIRNAIYRHHILVSLTAAIVIVGGAFLILRHYRVLRRERLEPGYEVEIGPAPGNGPAPTATLAEGTPKR